MNEVFDSTLSIRSYEDNLSGNISSIESSSGRDRMDSEERFSELKIINRSLTHAVQVRFQLAYKQSVVSIKFNRVMAKILTRTTSLSVLPILSKGTRLSFGRRRRSIEQIFR